MDLPCPVEFTPDAPDAAIHHVGRGNDVRPRLRMQQGLSGKDFECLVVQYVTARVIGVDQPILPVAGVGIERDVGDHPEFRKLLLQGDHGTGH